MTKPKFISQRELITAFGYMLALTIIVVERLNRSHGVKLATLTVRPNLGVVHRHTRIQDMIFLSSNQGDGIIRLLIYPPQLCCLSLWTIFLSTRTCLETRIAVNVNANLDKSKQSIVDSNSDTTI